MFLEMKEKDKEYPQLKETEWLCDLAFSVDLFGHMNELNVKLQGKGVFAHELYSDIKAFQVKLALFSRQVKQNTLTHFPTLESVANMETTDKYVDIITALDTEFARRFGDFKKLSPQFDILAAPFNADYEKAPDTIQLELIDLQCDSQLKDKFQQSERIYEFYASLSETKFANLRDMAMKLLVLFGSTYICEQTVSTMNINKSKLRSNLTDVHLHGLLRISTSELQPDFGGLVKNFSRPQLSH